MLDLYTSMVRIRRMEMAADAMYKQKQIRGFLHLCTGQEAVSVGIESALSKQDQVITAYRCHGFTHMRGASVLSILSELAGRQGGVAKGKGGSMHMFAPKFFGGNGIVGAQVPVGAGLAFAQKYKGEEAITLALYGDGASNQGQVFEAYNMTKLWGLRCVFICENNLYGMGTSAARSSALTEYHKRAGYIPGLKVNGMDVFAIKRGIEYAKQHVLEEKTPIVMELLTYRYGGHSMSDPGTTYRTREEIQRMRSEKDPITGLKQRMIDLGVVEGDGESLKQVEKEVRKQVDADVEHALSQSEPAESELWTEIYVPGSEPKELRGRISSESHRFVSS